MGRRPSVADWGSGMSASCKSWVQLFADAGNGCRIMRRGIISSCQSAATSEIVKPFWSRTHVRSAIASTQHSPFLLFYTFLEILSMGWGTLTCVGWQITPCGPIWQVTLRSSEMGYH